MRFCGDWIMVQVIFSYYFCRQLSANSSQYFISSHAIRFPIFQPISFRLAAINVQSHTQYLSIYDICILSLVVHFCSVSCTFSLSIEMIILTMITVLFINIIWFCMITVFLNISNFVLQYISVYYCFIIVVILTAWSNIIYFRFYFDFRIDYDVSSVKWHLHFYIGFSFI